MLLIMYYQGNIEEDHIKRRIFKLLKNRNKGMDFGHNEVSIIKM